MQLPGTPLTTVLFAMSAGFIAKNHPHHHWLKPKTQYSTSLSLIPRGEHFVKPFLRLFAKECMFLPKKDGRTSA
jgi:hypothetical protein